MALESSSDDFRSLNTKIDSVVLDCGDRGLRNPGKLPQLVLTETLELPNDADGLPDRDLDRPTRLSEVLPIHRTHLLR